MLKAIKKFFNSNKDDAAIRRYCEIEYGKEAVSVYNQIQLGYTIEAIRTTLK